MVVLHRAWLPTRCSVDYAIMSFRVSNAGKPLFFELCNTVYALK